MSSTAVAEPRSLAAWNVRHSVGSSASSQSEPRLSGVLRIPMWSFSSNGIQVRCRMPVEVVVQDDNGVVVAECDSLRVYANGKSVRQAVACLQEQIVHFYVEYSALKENQVTGLGAKLRQIYKKQFVKVE